MKELEHIEQDINPLKIYKELDNFYLALQHQAKIDAFIEYVHNPIKIFEDKL